MQIFFVLMYKICAFQEKYRLCSPEIQADCTYGNKMLRFHPRSARFLDIHSRFFLYMENAGIIQTYLEENTAFFDLNCISEEILFPYVQIMNCACPPLPRTARILDNGGAAAVIPEAAPDPLPPFQFRRCRTVLPARPPRRGLRRPAGWGRGGYFSRPGAGGPAAR